MTTKVFSISEEQQDISALEFSAEVIKKGGLVVFPTETVYGLGADATNPEAAKRIYAAKGRPSDNPLIIHICHPKDAEKYAFTNELYFKLAEKFMPGPLTVILKAKDTVPRETRGGLDTVAVRCPSNFVANKLIELSGVAIAAPSANLSGSPSPTCAAHVIDDMNGRVDVIIDGGDSDFGLESTIVKLNCDDTVTLLRPGKITPEELSCICDVTVDVAVSRELREGDVALSPGLKYKHYSPRARVVLLDGDITVAINHIKTVQGMKVAVMAFTEHIDTVKGELPDSVVFDFGSVSTPKEQAHKLFSTLREADKEGCDIVFAPLPKAEGVGLALYNRMIRASAHTIIKL